MKIKHVYLLISFYLFAGGTFANAIDVATVVQKRGLVKAKLANGIIISLSTDDKVPEGAIITTATKSFIKLVFIDKSQMNIGPSSQVHIQAFPTKEAGILRLLKGQLRAKVTKNYMEMDEKSKSKLYIQTKTASMGIRGTDFQVNYNTESENSSLIVFEGKVAMGHIERNMRDMVLDQKKLEEVVSNNTAVMVKQGQISAVNFNIAARALLPTKLAPKQFEALKDNPTGIEDKSPVKSNDDSKQYRDVIPPGVDGSAFINAPAEEIKGEIKDALGFRNEASGEFKPAAGTIIDLKTVNIISPPANANYDASSKTFVLTENYGKINEKSGQYIAPAGYELSTEGQFRPARPEVVSDDRNEVPKFEKAVEPKSEKEVASGSRKDSGTGSRVVDRVVDRIVDREKSEIPVDPKQYPNESAPIVIAAPEPILKIPEKTSPEIAPVKSTPLPVNPIIERPVYERPVAPEYSPPKTLPGEIIPVPIVSRPEPIYTAPAPLPPIAPVYIAPSPNNIAPPVYSPPVPRTTEPLPINQQPAVPPILGTKPIYQIR